MDVARGLVVLARLAWDGLSCVRRVRDEYDSCRLRGGLGLSKSVTLIMGVEPAMVNPLRLRPCSSRRWASLFSLRVKPPQARTRKTISLAAPRYRGAGTDAIVKGWLSIALIPGMLM